MYHLAKVTLENEMDLVLAHRRSMKLAEIAGLSLSAQTTFATAVSEVARNTIDNGRNGCLTLGISDEKKRSIIACIKDDNLNDPRNKDGLNYARRLVDRLNILSAEDEKSIELYHYVPNGDKIDKHQLDNWRSLFRNEPPLSPYDEIKRKNEQLRELTEQIRQSEDHYRQLTDNLPLMMFSLDEQGRVKYVNQWMLDYLGQSLESLTRMERPLPVHEDDRASGVTLRTLVQNKEPIRAEWRIKDRHGNYLWHLVSVNPIKREGEEAEWFGFLVDIHARKLFEQTLRDNRELKEVQQQLEFHIKELNRSNEELQQFAFVASHDLQEPLRKVIFYGDYLQSHHGGRLEEKSSKYLSGMIEASQRMRNLIADLLAYSQVDKRRLVLKEVNLGELLNETVTDYELVIQEKGATVTVAGATPVVEGDATMLRQLFGNLLSNSLKYIQPGVAPVIAITSTENDSMAVIEISDNGIGFDEHFLPKMFTLFQRLHGKDKFAGTGLGLNICHKIAEMHNGSIKASSKVNDGASFFVSLPLKQKA